MSDVANIALTAIRACEESASITANNIANVNTDGFKRSRAVMEEKAPSGVRASAERVNTPGDRVTIDGAERETSNVTLEEELIALITNQNHYEANIKTVKTGAEMQETFLDILA
jgi:flagellar hook protein FlgE